MHIDLITLFPSMFDALDQGIVGRALRNKLLSLRYWNPRDFSHDPHRTVDDRPFGGGPGMVMKFEPLHAAIKAAKEATPRSPRVILLSPQGTPLSQEAVLNFSQQQQLILVAGRYEGVDERVIEEDIDEEWSIGDYVLSGGELPAMVLIDAIVRLLPGALGDADSALQDSFTTGLLDHPHYTRPEVIAGKSTPSVLLSGNHSAIQQWRLKQALGKTWQKRRDLLKRRVLTAKEQSLLDEYIKEYQNEETS